MIPPAAARGRGGGGRWGGGRGKGRGGPLRGERKHLLLFIRGRGGVGEIYIGVYVFACMRVFN